MWIHLGNTGATVISFPKCEMTYTYIYTYAFNVNAIKAFTLFEIQIEWKQHKYKLRVDLLNKFWSNDIIEYKLGKTRCKNNGGTLCVLRGNTEAANARQGWGQDFSLKTFCVVIFNIISSEQ